MRKLAISSAVKFYYSLGQLPTVFSFEFVVAWIQKNVEIPQNISHNRMAAAMRNVVVNAKG